MTEPAFADLGLDAFVGFCPARDLAASRAVYGDPLGLERSRGAAAVGDERHAPLPAAP